MANIDFLILDNIWWVLVGWVLVYLGDYLLTLLGATLYSSDAQDHIVYEGSYELTPAFQKDVNALRWVNPRFFVFALLSSLLIYLIWWLDRQFLGILIFFPLAMGALFLREAAVYIRHFRNISLFGNIRRGKALEGQVKYRRWLVLRNSAVELFSFAFFYLLIFFLDSSWFFLGGTLACLVTGFQHFWWSRKLFRSERELEV